MLRRTPAAAGHRCRRRPARGDSRPRVWQRRRHGALRAATDRGAGHGMSAPVQQLQLGRGPNDEPVASAVRTLGQPVAVVLATTVQARQPIRRHDRSRLEGRRGGVQLAVTHAPESGSAAGIGDPRLRASYEACRRLNAAHGKTYYLATLLLPAAKRPYVHALYGFARYADETVDDLASTLGAEQKADQLQRWGDAFLGDLRAGRDSADPICHAVIDTTRRWAIPIGHFEDFLASMRMDLTVSSYPTYADLTGYMHGSAAVIGLQMTPILGPLADVAYGYAADLGIAFQLTNFLRDVGEDLRRGRLYLPLADLELFGVSRRGLTTGIVDDRTRDLLAFEVARTRALYRRAEPGIALLDPTSQDCVRTAFDLYGGILGEIERAGYHVLDQRVSVGLARRARHSAGADPGPVGFRASGRWFARHPS